MKKLLIILLSALSLTAVAQQKKVAVYVTGQQTGINKVLGDQLVAAFAKSGKYIAIERTASFLAELGKEQNYNVQEQLMIMSYPVWVNNSACSWYALLM